MKARIKFNKYGVIRFIGHLDLMRYFQKAMRRAHIDIAYSQGYNPHQIMSFASPLGLGITSDGEYLDISLNSDIDREDIITRLNEQMVEGVQVLDFVKLKDDAKNSMASIAAADYLVRVKDEYLSDKYVGKEEEVFKEKFIQFMNRESIKVIKKSKKTEKEINIKDFILNYSFDNMLPENTVMTEYENDYYVYLKLEAGSVNNLKPELVLNAFCDYCGVEYNKYAFQVHRINLYAYDKDELKPLSDIDNM